MGQVINGQQAVLHDDAIVLVLDHNLAKHRHQIALSEKGVEPIYPSSPLPTPTEVGIDCDQHGNLHHQILVLHIVQGGREDRLEHARRRDDLQVLLYCLLAPNAPTIQIAEG